MRVVLIRVDSDIMRRRRAEHALYAQGHADLHVQLILIKAGTAQPRLSIYQYINSISMSNHLVSKNKH